MVKIYVKRIKAGLMALDDVPAIWRDKVRTELIALGWPVESEGG